MTHKTLSTIIACLVLDLAALQLHAQILPASARIHSAVDDSQRVSLRGNIHPLAQARFDRGVAPDSLLLEHMILVLQRSPEQQQALDTLLEEQQDPASANYQKWLTSEEFGVRFGLAEVDIQTVASWLRSHGFQIDDIATARMTIQFSGTAGLLSDAFHTQMHKLEVNGEAHWANLTEPEIPSALSPVVRGFAGLNDFQPRSHAHVVEPSTDLTSGSHSLSPADFATIYNVNPLYAQGIDGTGTTIAVIGQTQINPQDVNDFRQLFGLPSKPPVLVPVPNNVPGTTSDLDEALLDVSWSGAVARNATVKYVYASGTATTYGIFLAAQYAINQNLADVMTLSYGECETNTSAAAFFNNLAQEAAGKGIAFMVSTGDAGSAACNNANTDATATNGVAVSYMASTIYTVAVGGTQFNDTTNPGKYWNANNNAAYGSALSYVPENVWNQSCAAGQTGCSKPNIWAGAGGVSTLYAKPGWQSGVPGIPNDRHRDIPDVSLAAAGHTPYIICMNGDCQGGKFPANGGLMGTSAAAPSFAGIMALVTQKAGKREGPANSVLYALAAKQAYSQCNGSSTSSLPASTCVFHDITAGNNAVPGEAGYDTSSETYNAGAGYDLATGLGSVNALNLVNQWASAKYAPTTTSLSISPATIPAGGSATVSVTVKPLSGSGTPTGSVALMASTGQTIATLSLSSGLVVTNVSDWPAGAYTVSAEYAGDGAYAPSNSAAVAVSAGQQSLQPVISSVMPNPVKVGQAVTITVNGSGFQSGLGAYIYLNNTYYPMQAVFVNANQVKFGVTMNGTGPYTAYVVIENPDKLTAAAAIQVVN